MLLVGCASVSDLQLSEPDRTGQSSKSIADVSRCIAYKSASAPIADEHGNPLFIIKNVHQAPIATVTLIDNGNGTTINVRQANGLVQTGFWRSCL